MISMDDKLKWQEWLRNHPTRAEDILRAAMADHASLYGLFEFQAIVHGFIVDFWFEKSNLAVEVDGSIHTTKEQIAKDIFKNEILEKYGIKVLRIKNEQVFKNIQRVLFRLISTINYKLKKDYFGRIKGKRKKKAAKSRFIKDHAIIYNGGPGIIRRKSNPAGASNPKTEQSAKR